MYHSLRTVEEVETYATAPKRYVIPALAKFLILRFHLSYLSKVGFCPYDTSAYLNIFKLIFTIMFDEDSEFRNFLCVVSFPLATSYSVSQYILAVL
jgi:hypothetical protein